MVERIYITIDERKYEWSGYFGCVLNSRERKVKQGDVRIIAGEFMYAYRVYKHFLERPEVYWCFVNNDLEKINSFKKKVFGV